MNHDVTIGFSKTVLPFRSKIDPCSFAMTPSTRLRTLSMIQYMILNDNSPENDMK